MTRDIIVPEKFTPISIEGDEDGHKYLLPQDKAQEFNDDLEWAIENDDYDDIVYKWDKYRIEGEPIQLYVDAEYFIYL